MTTSSTWTSLQVSLGSSGMTSAAPSAMDYAACARSDGHDAPSNAGHTQMQGPLQALVADARPRRDQDRLSGPRALPDGYVPIREARHLGLLGRWPLLDDGKSPCLPMKLLLCMRRRCELGDPDADAWLKLYARAYSGDAEAQHAFGRVCENGTYRAPADRQRAFFWYHRAALQGDSEARMATERLKRDTRIALAAMAEPMLVYPGTWQITAGMPGQVRTKSLFELAEDGSASGYRTGGGGVTAGVIGNALSAFAAPFTQSLFSLVMQNLQYSGRWTYDNTRKILALVFAASADGMPNSRNETWAVELVGCKVDSLYGRDQRNCTYILECGAREGSAQPAKCASAGERS